MFRGSEPSPYRHWPAEVPCVYIHLDCIQVRSRDGVLDDSVHLTADEAVQLAEALLDAAGALKGTESK